MQIEFEGDNFADVADDNRVILLTVPPSHTYMAGNAGTQIYKVSLLHTCTQGP